MSKSDQKLGLLVLLAAWSGGTARAASLFPAGTESKSAGMDSGLESRDAPSLLYNPANLSVGHVSGDSVPYAEIGMAQANYSYEHPDFDPVRVQVTSPTVTLGYSKLVNRKFAVGGVFFPAADSHQTINGLPREMTPGVVVPLAIDSKRQNLDLGLGMSYSPVERLRVGLTLIHEHASDSLSAAAIGGTTKLMDIDAHGEFNRAVLGTRLDTEHVALTLNGHPATTERYAGGKTVLGQDQTQAMVGYDPAVAGAGIDVHVGPVRAGVEATRLYWGAGSGIVKDPEATRDLHANLHDVTQRSATLGVTPKTGLDLKAGYALLPTPWGDGVEFGNLDGISRETYALGAALARSQATYTLAAYRSSGSREVAQGAGGAGFYRLDVTILTAGVATAF